MGTWRKYSDYTESVDNVRAAIVDAYGNFEIMRSQADMQGKGPLFLNGDCAIDQPNAGASVAATSSVYCRDGLLIQKGGAGGFSCQRQTNANLLTARNPVITCDRYTVTTAAASPGAGDYYSALMRIEGLRASRLQYGRASARRAWLCATARSSIDMTLSGSLKNNANDRSFPWSTALVANTTKDIAIDVSGCVDGTWLVDNGIGLQVSLALGLGSTYGGTANAWASANKLGVAGAGLMAVNGAVLDVTAWELVIGDTAPGFYIPPDPALELARCMREYERLLARFHANGMGSSQYVTYPWKVQKRAAPAMSSTGFTDTDASGAGLSAVNADINSLQSVDLTTNPAVGRRFNVTAIGDSRL